MGLKEAIRGKLNQISSQRSLKRYLRHNEQKFPRREGAKNVILVSRHDWNPSVYLYSLVCNFLADRTDAKIRTFSFDGERNERVDSLYASFGALPGLTKEGLAATMDEAVRRRDEILDGLKSKWDLLNITIGDVRLGDLIYDTYLRYYTVATIDLADPRLHAMILDAIAILLATEKYLAEHNVVGIFPDHTVYIYSGVLVRCAFARGIPVYMLPYNPNFYILQLDPQLSEGMSNVSKRWSYYKYRELFDLLPPDRQEAGRAEARQGLQNRLGGQMSEVLVGVTAYGQRSEQRLLSTSEKPKILVLLHDFCDSVHAFREMLFPDFYEWAHYLLAKAGETDFEWYVKPHPNSISSKEKNITNAAVVAELARKYPYIKVVEASASNRQLVEEGIVAAHTVHGTVGHELAYLGVPVVNSGDNMHVAFDFNIHPKSVEALDELILHADRLRDHPIDPEEVEAFFYMHYFYFRERNVSPVNPFPEDWLKQPDVVGRSRKNEALTVFLEGESAEKTAALDAYLGDFFDSKSRTVGGVQWASIGTG